MSSQNRVRILAELQNHVSSGLDKIRDDFDRLGKSAGAKSILQGVGMGAGLSAWNLLGSAVDKTTQFIGDSIKAASDQNEQINKAEVVFGSAARAVEAFGDRSAMALGLSKTAALEAASGFGQFFEGAGQAQAKAESMSETMVQLAADLASFDNLDPSDVLAKLKSGLAGEAEPLRAVGVFLNENAVKAKAMQLGLADAHGELSDGAKILARYQIILDQTKDAQGDFARTSDSLANSERRKNAELEDTQAKLGRSFTPIAQGFEQLQIAALDFVSRGLDGWHMYLDTNDHYVIALGESEKAVGHLTDAVDHFQGEAPQAIRAVVPAAHDARKSILEIGQAADKAGEKTSDLADQLEDALYGKSIRAGKRQELKDQIADLGAELKKTKDKGDATVLRGQIDGLKEELMTLDLQIAEAKGPAALKATLDSWRIKFGNGSSAAQKLIDKLEGLYAAAGKLPSVNIRVSGDPRLNSNTERRAAGGPVNPGGAYLVGEHGPELLFMGRQGGQIVPNASGSSSGGSPVTLSIALDGREIARVVDRHLYYGAQAAASSRLRS